MQNGLKSKFFLLLLLFGVLPSIVSAWELKPVNSMQLYPEPDTDARLIFSADTPAESDFLPYDLLNYAGEKVFSGKLLRNKDNRWELTFNRPAGFYEIELENGQRIGVLAAPTAKKPYDDFFAHEALFGGESPSYIRDHIAVFRKFGLLNVREYCGWQDMAQHGNYSGQRAILDTLHDGGLRSMIFFNRLPAVANVGGKSNLPRYMHKLSDEADRLLDCSSNADYIQVYNEFVNRPGDASVPATVLFGNRIREKHSQAVLIGQGMCAAQQSVSAVSSFVQNGYHELTEALCIQTYAAPEAIEAIIRDYREALKGDDRQGMDLWCTESGKPWYRGGVSATLKGKVSAEKRRADILEDQISAKGLSPVLSHLLPCLHRSLLHIRDGQVGQFPLRPVAYGLSRLLPRGLFGALAEEPVPLHGLRDILHPRGRLGAVYQLFLPVSSGHEHVHHPQRPFPGIYHHACRQGQEIHNRMHRWDRFRMAASRRVLHPLVGDRAWGGPYDIDLVQIGSMTLFLTSAFIVGFSMVMHLRREIDMKEMESRQEIIIKELENEKEALESMRRYHHDIRHHAAVMREYLRMGTWRARRSTLSSSRPPSTAMPARHGARTGSPMPS